jgi:ABC-type uncharacterized transport system substrate-binding protein
MLFVTVTGHAYGHPHVYVVYSVTLPLGPQGLTGVGFVFTFDPMFSARILRDVGDDPESVVSNHARVLQQVPYEIEITFNGNPLALEAPRDLHVTVDGGLVTYRFVVPFQAPILPPGTIDITVGDPDLFVAFALRGSDPAEVQTSGPFTAACERVLTQSGAPGPLRCQYAAGSGRRRPPGGARASTPAVALVGGQG